MANKFIVSSRGALYRGAVDDNSPHKHYALQWTLGINAPFKFYSDKPEENSRMTVVESDRLHTISGENTDFLFLLVEPHSPEAFFLKKVTKDPQWRDPFLSGPIPAYLGEIIDGYRGEISPDLLIGNLLKEIGYSEKESERFDSRIEAVIKLISNGIKESQAGSFSIPGLAGSVFLSESRLQHLFKQKTGIPISRYIQWERIKAAVKVAGSGGDLTEAAIEAGFSDAAYLSRTFKAMFGLNPSKILKESRFVQVYSG